MPRAGTPEDISLRIVIAKYPSQRTFNPSVLGSNPSRLTFFTLPALLPQVDANTLWVRLTTQQTHAAVPPNRVGASLREWFMADDTTAEQWWSAILTGDNLNVPVQQLIHAF